jgi:hypothetical protein
MKKLLLAFAILGFVACNNEGEKTEGTDTTTAAPAADTTVVDTTAAPAADTTAPAADTTAPAAK